MRKRLLFALLSILCVVLNVQAQSVTVSPSTGNLIAALTYEGEQGFANGWSAMWRHEQLPLSFTVADDNLKTPGGEIYNPACNICVYNGNLIIAGGQTKDLYCVLSLPKGYRFKGYKMVLLNNLNGGSANNLSFGRQTKVMYETDSTYTYTNNRYKARGYYDDNHNTYQMSNSTSNNEKTREYIITRESRTDTDMGNQLYFHMTHSSNSSYYGVTIKSFTVYFTAEGTFETDITPKSAGTVKSLVMSPFKTNKIDIGAVKDTTKSGKTYFAYTYTNVRDLDAYTYIYQDSAILNGVPLDVAPKKKIHPVTIDGKNYFAFENGTYYAEGPTQIYSQTGISLPIGFRVVGAGFEPLWKSQTTGTSETKEVYYIRYTSGGTEYFLNNSLQYTTQPFGWEVDEGKNIVDPESGQYLSCYGSGNNRYVTFSTNPTAQWNLRLGLVTGSNNYVYYLSDGGNYYYLLSTAYAGDDANGAGRPGIVKDATTNRVSSRKVNVTYTSASYKPGSYTLNVFNMKGDSIAETRTVSSASTTGERFDMVGFNNDAVKFQITGLPEGCQALVNVSLFMQALNPYIDNMELVCHDPNEQWTLSQPFTAADFKVAGEAFKFYIPSGYANTNLRFTFSDLYSSYGDNTYYVGTGKQKNGVARYCFVTSPYFEPVDQNGDNGLYDSAYNPDASYVDKVYANTSGNIRFRFNNADELKNTSTNHPEINYLKEYPFTVKSYIGSDDPDGGTEKGAFNTVTLNASSTATKSDTCYVFTADETRYNIAPSTAWQHRYYAFYRMDIELEAKTYVPDITWTKIYDNTCYVKNGAETHEAMWGMKLAAKDPNTNKIVEEGYLTVKEIDDAITAALGKEGCPTTSDQILYVDGNDLYSIVSSNTVTLDSLKSRLATNALFYLPKGTTSTLDNCAYYTGNNMFRAGRDFVLTDKEPFYAPYGVQVDKDNEMIYKRQITLDKYGKVQNATIILPFVITVDDGVHTNPDGSKFTLHQLQSQNSLENIDGLTYAYMPALGNAITETTANTPYVVHLDELYQAEDGVSFVVVQQGAPISPTTSMDDDYTFKGETGIGIGFAEGDAEGVTYTMTSKGSYSGKLIDKSETAPIFYFARNHFVCSTSLDSNHNTVKVAPFRSYYEAKASRNLISSMEIIFGEGLGDVTGINDVTRRIDTGVMGGKGTITVSSAIDNMVKIHSANGMSIYNLDMQAGETKTVNVPAGVYVVNGVKIIVK